MSRNVHLLLKPKKTWKGNFGHQKLRKLMSIQNLWKKIQLF